MERKSRSSRSHDEELSLWKQICSSLIKLEGIQKDEESVLSTINKIQLSVNVEKVGITSLIHQKLKDNYRRGIELSLTESKTIGDIIEKISVLVALRDNEQDFKKKKRKLEIEDSTINGGGSSHIITRGTTVAARQPKEKDKNEEWILAVVLQYHPDKNKYQVEDVDQDDFGEKQRYMLPPRYVIPVKSSEEAKLSPEIPAYQDVLALYPGTTCFYKATVIAPPSKVKVQFEDDNDEVKYIMPEHVIEMPKSK
ncbi:hypothetical protein INT48_005441 [Thamnidium elegans]|uniref:SGF29 C-terminal domain-containing protein n=1 Tax=Thamnidium elegans TaxID=101142 RepID=A0A8H7VR92_9FUNG|nr:hypothetical protein INT48_005441 [Thamnidium elegans]